MAQGRNVVSPRIRQKKKGNRQDCARSVGILGFTNPRPPRRVAPPALFKQFFSSGHERGHAAFRAHVPLVLGATENSPQASQKAFQDFASPSRGVTPVSNRSPVLGCKVPLLAINVCGWGSLVRPKEWPGGPLWNASKPISCPLPLPQMPQ